MSLAYGNVINKIFLLPHQMLMIKQILFQRKLYLESQYTIILAMSVLKLFLNISWDKLQK